MKEQIQILEDGTQVLLIHLVYRSPAGLTSSIGEPVAPDRPPTWKIACTPNLLEMAATQSRAHPWLRTDDPRAVSCPMCKKTPVFQDLLAAQRRPV